MTRGLVFLLVLAMASGVADARPRSKAKKKKTHHAHRQRRQPRDPHAKERYSHALDPATTPAVRYGSMTAEACEAELVARAIPHQAEAADGVAMPVRVTAPLHGVTFHSGVSEAERATSPYEITDCRMVLALDDLAGLLAQHGVTEVVHYSIYRRPGKGTPEGAHLSQHNGGLAIDAARFIKADGSSLSVLDDFHGRIGDRTCGPKAKPRTRHPSEKTTEIRALLCEIADQHLFNVVLTPNFNRPHRNHFHLDLTIGVSWFLVH